MSFLSRFKFWNEYCSAIIIVIGFVISRLAFRLSGIYFYHEFVKRMWQSIDVELMKSDLLQSLWYSHAQPPLFNLLTGIVVKVFPQHYGHVFHVLIALMTLFTGLFLWGILLKTKLPTWASLAIVFYYMLCPSVVLYESLFSYTPFVVLLITASIYFLLSFLENNKTIDWLWFWVSLCSLSLTRSSFHLLWLIAIFGLMVFLLRKNDT